MGVGKKHPAARNANGQGTEKIRQKKYAEASAPGHRIITGHNCT
jgi:hypothetical protein